jgi:creatinine amidohydrolase/Fe(II)-dependent formamide hydrolase-like protein
MKRLLCLLIAAALHASAAPAATAAPLGRVFLEEMSSPELQAALHQGATTIIIPVGGTEQNGPHMALGKHNVRVKVLAGRIATQLGNTIVAPVLPYVPEGGITPPQAHMRWAGTISISDDAFKAVLDGAARSFRQHGFTDIVLIGDHGGYQGQLAAVAARLNRDWASTPARAHFIAAYYLAAQGPYLQALRSAGLSAAQIGTHAGTADTALMLATDPALVNPADYAAAAQGAPANGVVGDPQAATAALGRLGTDAVVNATVAAIRGVLNSRR